MFMLSNIKSNANRVILNLNRWGNKRTTSLSFKNLLIPIALSVFAISLLIKIICSLRKSIKKQNDQIAEYMNRFGQYDDRIRHKEQELADKNEYIKNCFTREEYDHVILSLTKKEEEYNLAMDSLKQKDEDLEEHKSVIRDCSSDEKNLMMKVVEMETDQEALKIELQKTKSRAVLMENIIATMCQESKEKDQRLKEAYSSDSHQRKSGPDLLSNTPASSKSMLQEIEQLKIESFFKSLKDNSLKDLPQATKNSSQQNAFSEEYQELKNKNRMLTEEIQLKSEELTKTKASEERLKDKVITMSNLIPLSVEEQFDLSENMHYIDELFGQLKVNED